MSDNVEANGVVECGAEQPKKKCFIITPIGPANSTIRRATDGLIKSAIVPILEELGFEADIPHEMLDSGSITKRVISKIYEDELVIANLTGLNPNVMYELGIRHCFRKPVIHIRESSTKLPFDIAPERALEYVDDMYGIQEFKPNLKKAIESVMQEKEVSNPVYDAIQTESIMANIKEDDPLKYIIKSIDELKRFFNRNNFGKNKYSDLYKIEDGFPREDKLCLRANLQSKTYVSDVMFSIRNYFKVTFGVDPQISVLEPNSEREEYEINILFPKMFYLENGVTKGEILNSVIEVIKQYFVK